MILKGLLTFLCRRFFISQGRTRLVLGQRVAVLFILLTLSTLVFQSKAKICISDLIKLFFSASPPIISSKSSCSLFVRLSKKSKAPSLESPSTCCSYKNSKFFFHFFKGRWSNNFNFIFFFSSFEFHVKKIA